MSPRTRRTPRCRGAIAAGLIAASLSAVGCGTTRSPGQPSGSARTDGSTAVVSIDTFRFSPARVQVAVGGTVTWANHDDIVHTVTSGTRDYEPGNSGHVTATRRDGAFDLELDGRGAEATRTFDEAGTFHYFCDRHPGMEADVEVRPR